MEEDSIMENNTAIQVEIEQAPETIFPFQNTKKKEKISRKKKHRKYS